MISNNEIGELLSSARRAVGLTQAQLAKKAGVYQSVVSDLESGKRHPPFSLLATLARTLKVSIQCFLTGSDYVGNELPDISIQLHNLGIVDLHVENENVPGAFRADEDVIALSVSGNAPQPRILEAIPAVLAWNTWKPVLLHAFAQVHDARACFRLGWLADIALTIHRNHGFPGGCKAPILEEFIDLVSEKPPVLEDTLGYMDANEPLPPVSRRWKIRNPASLETFQERAKRLLSMRGKTLSRALRVP